LNPDFATSFKLNFIFEKRQFYYIEIRDIDDGIGNKYDEMGGFNFELGELMGSLNQTITKQISHGGKQMGTLILRAEKVELQNNLISFQMSCKNVKGGGCFSSAKPFIK